MKVDLKRVPVKCKCGKVLGNMAGYGMHRSCAAAKGLDADHYPYIVMWKPGQREIFLKERGLS